MRYVIAAVVVVLGLIMPVRAQSTFTQGFYEFENVVASMSYTGTWSSSTAVSTVSGVGRTTSVVGSSVSFYSAGETVVIWRLVRASGITSKMDVCVNGSCINVSNESVSTVNYWYPYVVTIVPGSLITVTLTSGVIWLDNLMILGGISGGGFPTPVPTATILPSSTPAYTATPGPTPVHTATAVPTATPYTLPSAIIAIDPSASYSDYNGQIVAWSFRFTAGEVVVAVLLAGVIGMQVFSWWTSGSDPGDQK